jgi:hypothetical protein
MKNKKFEFTGSYNIKNDKNSNQIHINNIKFEFKEIEKKNIIYYLKKVFPCCFSK